MTRSLPAGVVFRLWFYRAVFPFVLLCMLPGMIRRMIKRGNFRRNFGQRFGFFSNGLRQRLSGGKTVWLQSISVGETNVSLKLAREILSRNPALQIVISVTTSTGFDLASRAGSPNIHAIYNPIDLASIVRRTLRAVDPQALILVEAVWPVLVAEAARRDIPVSLVARLSPRSRRRFLRFRWMTGPIFHLLDHVFVSDREDLATWIALGAKSIAVQCPGAIKYDEPPSDISPRTDFQEILTNLGWSPADPVLLAGSTFAGEERILVDTFLQLRVRFPKLFLILVPRHVERTPDILEELRPLGLEIARRTQPFRSKKADLLLVDTTGELRDWYALATIVFIGKSLTSHGGQNPVEAVWHGKPVIFGPHMENFAPVVRDWLADAAAVQVADASDLPMKIEQLLLNPENRDKMARRAVHSISLHLGATSRVVDFLHLH